MKFKCLLLIIYTFSNNWRKIYVETGFSFVRKDDLFFGSGVLGLALTDTIGEHLFNYLFGWTVLFRSIEIMWLGHTWTERKEMKTMHAKTKKKKTENKEKQKKYILRKRHAMIPKICRSTKPIYYQHQGIFATG